MTNTTVNTFNSSHADWASQTTDAAQLAELNLFIGDVSNAIVDNKSGEGRGQSVHANFMQHLLAERVRLEKNVRVAAGLASAFDGSNETNLLPVF